MAIHKSELRQSIPASVYLLGVISFLNDIATEMLYPILPIFLVQVLNAPVFVLGIIDGVAEGIAALFKVYFGYLSDKTHRRKPFIVAGYSIAAVAKLIIAISFSWLIVFIGRVLDRFGKGVRTAARDALLLDVTTSHNKGLIFGVHRTFDSAGAVVGPLLALGLLNFFDNNIRLVLVVAVVPAFVVLFFFVFIRESQSTATPPTKKLTLGLSLNKMSRPFKLFLVIFAIFSLGNSSDSFLILRSQQLGLSISLVVLVYVIYNLVYTLLSTPAGILADKLGAKRVFLAGLVIFAAVYAGFGLNSEPAVVWVLFPVYGAYIALTDGVSKALIGSYITRDEGGTAYGTFQTGASLFTFLSSIIAGLLWSVIGPAAPFYFGATCALLALVLFIGLDAGRTDD